MFLLFLPYSPGTQCDFHRNAHRNVVPHFPKIWCCHHASSFLYSEYFLSLWTERNTIVIVRSLQLFSFLPFCWPGACRLAALSAMSASTHVLLCIGTKPWAVQARQALTTVYAPLKARHLSSVEWKNFYVLSVPTQSSFLIEMKQVQLLTAIGTKMHICSEAIPLASEFAYHRTQNT